MSQQKIQCVYSLALVPWVLFKGFSYVLCRQVMEILSESPQSACQTGCDMWMGQINELEVHWEEKEVIIK